MKFHKLVAILAVLFAFQVQAQKYELGKVTIKELEEKVYAADTSAAAAITYTKGRTFFRYTVTKGFTTYHEYEFRIKIYKKEGLKWGNFEVPFFVGYEDLDADYIGFSEGVTYNLENGQMAKTKLTGKGTFRKDVNEFWNVAAIAMPNVKVGSVIEFKYTHKSEDLRDFPQFYFQYEIPVKYAEYKTEVPEFFIYKPVVIGFGNVKSDAKIVGGHQNFSNEHQQTVNLSFQQINSSYIAENVAALRDEPYVDNMANYRSSVEHELEKTRFPDAPEKNFTSNWEGVSKTIFKDKRFGTELAERQYFEQDIPAVLRNKASAQERTTAILQHLKRTVKWDGTYGYYTKKGVRKAYFEKSGNIAEINFILIAMLNYAGINAHPVLLSTVDHGIPAYPNLRVFNYVIAAVEIDGQKVLYDATDVNALGNILPGRDLNWTGRLIRKDGSSEEINLVPDTPSREMVSLMAKIDAKGNINGMARIQKTDYKAYAFRDKYAKGKQDYIENLEQRFGGIKISDYIAENIDDLPKPITETFNFASDNHVEVIADKLYINPLLFFTQNANPFVMEDRKLPIYYGYPVQGRYNISLEIPEGYTVESLPVTMNIATGENVGQFQMSIASTANKIQVTALQQINMAMVSASFYANLKVFYQQMTSKQNEKIVLKKI